VTRKRTVGHGYQHEKICGGEKELDLCCITRPSEKKSASSGDVMGDGLVKLVRLLGKVADAGGTRWME